MESGGGKSTIIKAFLDPAMRAVDLLDRFEESMQNDAELVATRGAESIVVSDGSGALSSDETVPSESSQCKKKKKKAGGTRERKRIVFLGGGFTDAGAHKVIEAGPTVYVSAEAQTLLHFLEAKKESEFVQSMVSMYSGELVGKRLRDEEHSWSIRNPRFNVFAMAQPGVWEKMEKNSPLYIQQGGLARWVSLPLGSAELPVIAAPPAVREALDGEFFVGRRVPSS